MRNFRTMIASLSLVAIMSSFVASTALAGDLTFKDLAKDHYAYAAVQNLVSKGVIDGTKENFNTNANVSRAEVAKMVVIAANLKADPSKTSNFSDVSATAWDGKMKEYIDIAFAHGIVSGYGNTGKFGPTDTVTRAQLAKMVVNAFGLAIYTPTTATFPDLGSEQWLKDAVETAYHWTVVSGMTDGTFAPNKAIIRADAAMMINAGLSPVERKGTPAPSTLSGDLTVTVETPETFKTIVPSTADYVPVMDLVLKANEDVSVTKLIVTRGGLSQNSDVDVMSLFVDGVQYGSNTSVNSNNQVSFNLASTPITVKAGKQAVVNVTVNPSATAATGDIFLFSVDSADGIISDAATVGADFPLKGDQFSISTTTIGTYTLAAGPDNPTSDYTPEAGTTARLLQWKITASTENQKLESFTLTENGTAATTDYGKLYVYNDTTGKKICEAEAWDGSGKLTCVPSEEVLVKKGESANFSLKVDIKKGSGTTMSAKIRDGGAYGIKLRGTQYGYLVGTASAWAGTATAQTIAAGALVVTLASSTPATGNVAAGGQGVILARYNMEAKGEPVTVTALSANLTFGGTPAVYTQFTNCSLKLEKDGKSETLAGPVDAASDSDIDFTDTFEVPVGMNTVALACNLATDLATNDTVIADVTPSTGITAKGATTNDTITASGAVAIPGKTLTVKSGSIVGINMTTPPATSVIPGTANVHFADVQLDATASGEDVKVTTIVITSTPSSGASAADLQNIGLYSSYVPEASCTGTNQYWNPTLKLCRLDSLNQATTTAINTAESETYSLETPFVIKKGEAAIVKVYADYKAGIGAATEQFIIDGESVSGTGSSTGTTVSDAAFTNAGQAMVYAATGVLTTTWGANPTSDENAIAGTSKVLYGDYKLQATKEGAILSTVAFTRTSALTGADADFGQVHLYRVDGSTEKLLQSAYLASSVATFDLQSAGVSEADRTIAKDATVKLRVYADMKSTTAGGTSGDVNKFTLAATGDLVAVGAGSGSTINASAVVTGSTSKVVRKTVPTIALANTGLTTNLSNGSMKLIKFTVAADPNGDVALKKFQFSLALNDADADAGLVLTAVKLYDASNTSTPIGLVEADGTTDDTTVTSCADGAGAYTPTNADGGIIICAPQTEEIISAGTSKTYYLQGTIAGSETSDSISVSLAQGASALTADSDASYVDESGTAVVLLDTALTLKNGTETNAFWIWSDMSATSHSDSLANGAGTGDWTGEYYLKTIPSDTFTLSRS